ncbi:hypothetical protein [Burkholderia cenocepacia]|uniref:hypothetical protein n=1 Tax=Burkholderia cenocepacia TaxID=95486 RepID=UPI0021AB1DBD|nr:hypothetical protein [Burkholderia cenocepacia]
MWSFAPAGSDDEALLCYKSPREYYISAGDTGAVGRRRRSNGENNHMALNFDAVIDSPEPSVDMKAGLDTLQGVSDVARCIAETLLTEHVPQRQTHKKDIRTILKQSFKGSYGHIFGIEIYDDKVQKRFNQIGRATFLELMSHFLDEAVYKVREHDLSIEAAQVIAELGDRGDSLVEQLRRSPMKNLHQVSEKFGYEVKIRYRKNSHDQTVLASFDQNTAETILARLGRKDVQITAAITRLNINTGNGRLELLGGGNTVAFGFQGKYEDVPLAIKDKIAANLAYNNGKLPENRHHLDIVARPIELKGGKVVKYIIKEL